MLKTKLLKIATLDWAGSSGSELGILKDTCALTLLLTKLVDGGWGKLTWVLKAPSEGSDA